MSAETNVQPGMTLIGEFFPLRPPRVVTVERVTPSGQIVIAGEPARYKSLNAECTRGLLIGSPEHRDIPSRVRLVTADDDLEAIAQAYKAHQKEEAAKNRRHARVRSLQRRAAAFSEKHLAWGGDTPRDWPYTDEQLDALDAALKALEEQA